MTSLSMNVLFLKLKPLMKEFDQTITVMTLQEVYVVFEYL